MLTTLDAPPRPPATASVSRRRSHAVVIGSGFGGLAAAVRLGARGYRVTVLEKLDTPGGRAYVYRQDGFTFDAGPTIVTAETKKAMKAALERIQTGEYAKQFILENRAGAPTLQARRRIMGEHPIEVVGEKLRAMMPWIKANKLVDKSRN